MRLVSGAKTGSPAPYRNAFSTTAVDGLECTVTLLRHLSREYSLADIALMTRSAPARLLGLPDRGHLTPGAVADISVYHDNADREAMFRHAHLVMKDGVIVVKDGRVTHATQGRTHAVAPDFDLGIETPLSAYFDRFHLCRMEHYGLRHPALAEDLGMQLVLH